MTTILLARHAESDWNAEGRWQGHADRPLTARGREQAKELGDSLVSRPVDVVYSSDLRRAWETAEIALAPRQVEIHRTPGLREVDVGNWTGLTRLEVEIRFPDGVRRWKNGKRGWDGGESYEAMGARVVRTTQRIAEQHEGSTVFIVSHGGSIRAIKAHAAGADFHSYRLANPVEQNAVLSAVRVLNGRMIPLAIH